MSVNRADKEKEVAELKARLEDQEMCRRYP